MDANDDAFLTYILAGGDLGLLSMALLAPNIEMSRGRARLISIAGVAGGIAGLGLDLLLRPSGDNIAILIPMITSAIGLGAGVHLTESETRAATEPVEAPRPPERVPGTIR